MALVLHCKNWLAHNVREKESEMLDPEMQSRSGYNCMLQKMCLVNSEIYNNGSIRNGRNRWIQH